MLQNMTHDLLKPAYIKLQRCWVCRLHVWFDCTILENMLLPVVLGENRCCFKQILKCFDLVWHLTPPARSMTTPWNGKCQFPVGKISSHLANASSHLVITPTSICNFVRCAYWHQLSETLTWQTKYGKFTTRSLTITSTLTGTAFRL